MHLKNFNHIKRQRERVCTYMSEKHVKFVKKDYPTTFQSASHSGLLKQLSTLSLFSICFMCFLTSKN